MNRRKKINMRADEKDKKSGRRVKCAGFGMFVSMKIVFRTVFNVCMCKSMHHAACCYCRSNRMVNE